MCREHRQLMIDETGLNRVTPLTSFLCRMYFNTSSTVCDGGIVAVNGSNGAILWTTWLDDAVFAVDCVADFDSDGIIDCTVTGKSRVRVMKNFWRPSESSILFIAIGAVDCQFQGRQTTLGDSHRQVATPLFGWF